MRSYYEHLAILRHHYAEVDALLSGELPSVIANSFQNPPSKSHTRLRGDLAEEVSSETDGSPGWLRRESAWKVRRQMNAENGHRDPEAGERTALLSLEEKEEERDRLARFALNGLSP